MLTPTGPCDSWRRTAQGTPTPRLDAHSRRFKCVHFLNFRLGSLTSAPSVHCSWRSFPFVTVILDLNACARRCHRPANPFRVPCPNHSQCNITILGHDCSLSHMLPGRNTIARLVLDPQAEARQSLRQPLRPSWLSAHCWICDLFLFSGMRAAVMWYRVPFVYPPTGTTARQCVHPARPGGRTDAQSRCFLASATCSSSLFTW
jgi:hypothetical protein